MVLTVGKTMAGEDSTLRFLEKALFIYAKIFMR